MRWSPTPMNTEDHKAKTWQMPKPNHPWRQYKDKKKIELPDRTDIVPLREFLEEIVENYERIEITTFGDLGDRTYTLSSVSQKRAAAYICNILKKNYVQR